MSVFVMGAVSALLLLDPEGQAEVSAKRAMPTGAVSVADGRSGLGNVSYKKGQCAEITSVACDFDRREGVAMFEGNVVLRYASDYVLCADRLWAFAVGTNQLGRAVAIGRVSITNGTRVGSCEMAVYRRKRGEIEMFWNGTNALARLVDGGDDASALEGTRIKFWIDTEQVEVDDSRITTKEQRDGKKLL